MGGNRDFFVLVADLSPTRPFAEARDAFHSFIFHTLTLLLSRLDLSTPQDFILPRNGILLLVHQVVIRY